MMPTIHDYINICLTCPHKEQDGGFHLCTFDGVNIVEHAASGKCPKGRYSLPVVTQHRPRSRGLGDTIAKVTAATKIDKVVKAVTKAVGIKDCGCNKRREVLNGLVPYAAITKTEK